MPARPSVTPPYNTVWVVGNLQRRTPIWRQEKIQIDAFIHCTVFCQPTELHYPRACPSTAVNAKALSRNASYFANCFAGCGAPYSKLSVHILPPQFFPFYCSFLLFSELSNFVTWPLILHIVAHVWSSLCELPESNTWPSPIRLLSISLSLSNHLLLRIRPTNSLL